MKSRLPFPIPQLYPELERVGGRKDQLRALIRINWGNEILFVFLPVASLCILSLVSTSLMPGGIAAIVRNWFNVSPDAAMIVEKLTVVVIMFVVVVAGTYFGAPLARRKLRLELAQSGHAICIDCGYDLTGNESDVCPECGKTVGKAK